MNQIPKVGDKIHAVYVESGRDVKAIHLGTVTKISKKGKCFYDSEGTERGYTFIVNNGIKLIGFTSTEKSAKEDGDRSSDND